MQCITLHSKASITWLSVATLCIGVLFLSSDSLWIDEGNAAYKALQPDLASWFHALVSQGGSDAQMPGYMLYIWVWEKLFGSTEFALRASNIPWFLLAAASLRRSPLMAFALITSPFVLYYLNELRPYLIQVAGAAVVFSCFVDNELGAETKFRKFLVGNFILCASSLTGVLWSAGALVSFVMCNRQVLGQKSFWRDLLLSSPLFLGLGAYYVHTLLLGQGAALMGGSLVLSIAACAYELGGLMGLGPGRNELRENPRLVLEYALPLAAGVLVFGTAYLSGLVDILKKIPRRNLVTAFIGVAVPIAILSSLVILKDFRLLARHLAPLSVVLAFVLARQFDLAIHRDGKSLFHRVTAILVIAVGVWSALSLRFADRHRKDAYKDAAAIAKEAMATGREVWWAADGPTAIYYGLNADLRNFNFIDTSRSVPDFPSSGLIIMTKPDIVDPKGKLRESLEQRNFRVSQSLQAFTVWTSSDPK